MAPAADGTRGFRLARLAPHRSGGRLTIADLAAVLRELEERLLSAEGRASPDLLDALLGEDFVEIGRSGDRFGKREALAGLAEEAGDGNVYERTTSDWAVRSLAEGVALIDYHIIQHDRTQGTAVASRRSSIWSFRDGRWQMVFHQGTRLRPRQ